MPPGSAREAAPVRGRRRRGHAPRWMVVRGVSFVDPFAQRGRDGAGAVSDAELAVNGAEVTLDRLVADHKLGGDGAVGQAVDHERQDLAFALCQALARARPELVAL